jgi:ankyrin repeat protein
LRIHFYFLLIFLLLKVCYDCHNFDLEIVRCLHKNGADLNAVNNEGFFPLYYGIIFLLFIFIQLKNSNLATLFCNIDLLTYLIDSNDIDLNLKDKNGNTVLNKASEMGAIVLIELLLLRETKKCDINLKNNLGLDAVYLACLNEHYDAMRYLISKSADINTQGVNGNTLLHHGI